MILLIDNYDSFVYSLYQMAGSVYEKLKGGSQEELIVVRRNDAVTIGEIEQMGPKALILSPGPGRPEQAGICQEAIVHFAGKIPGTSGDLPGVWRNDYLREGADAWQDFGNSGGHRQSFVQGTGKSSDGGQIPFAGSGESAGRTEGDGYDQ